MADLVLQKFILFLEITGLKRNLETRLTRDARCIAHSFVIVLKEFPLQLVKRIVQRLGLKGGLYEVLDVGAGLVGISILLSLADLVNLSMRTHETSSRPHQIAILPLVVLKLSLNLLELLGVCHLSIRDVLVLLIEQLLVLFLQLENLLVSLLPSLVQLALSLLLVAQLVAEIPFSGKVGLNLALLVHQMVLQVCTLLLPLAHHILQRVFQLNLFIRNLLLQRVQLPLQLIFFFLRLSDLLLEILHQQSLVLLGFLILLLSYKLSLLNPLLTQLPLLLLPRDQREHLRVQILNLQHEPLVRLVQL